MAKRKSGTFRKGQAVGRIEGVCGGAVCIKGTRLMVSIIASRFCAGESISSIAYDYSQPAWKIEEAIRVFLAALPGHRGEKVQQRMEEQVPLVLRPSQRGAPPR